MKIAFLDCDPNTHKIWRKAAHAFAAGVRQHGHEFDFLTAEDFVIRAQQQEFHAMVHFHYSDAARDAIQLCRTLQIPFYWIEGAYVNRHDQAGQQAWADTWFRVTKNGNQAGYRADRAEDTSRFDLAFNGVDIREWRKSADSVVLCEAAQDMLDFDERISGWEFDAREYLADIGCSLPLIERRRDAVSGLAPFREMLRGISPVVFTYNSNAAVEAMLSGCPVVVSVESICYLFSRWNLFNLWRNDRQPLWNLISWSQFQVSEMMSGAAWEILNR